MLYYILAPTNFNMSDGLLKEERQTDRQGKQLVRTEAHIGGVQLQVKNAREYGQQGLRGWRTGPPAQNLPAFDF